MPASSMHPKVRPRAFFLLFLQTTETRNRLSAPFFSNHFFSPRRWELTLASWGVSFSITRLPSSLGYGACFWVQHP